MPTGIREPSKGSVKAMIILGSIVAFMGGSVMLGWHLFQFGLIGPYGYFTSMPYNTALAFFLGGFSCVIFKFGYRITALGMAWGVAFIGYLTLLEYFLGIDLGIDQPIVDQSSIDLSSNPGRIDKSDFFIFGKSEYPFSH